LYRGQLTTRAGRWLLESGIRRSSGGYARYYEADKGRNRAVSTEISGYVASTLVWLFRTTGDAEYLDAARNAARFLVSAWDPQLRTFPYEHPSPSSESEHLSYFFDCGIIARGLIAVWRETGEDELFEVARNAARGMVADFDAEREYHPILNLPDKSPLHRGAGWSRNPGCYQLKAALSWHEIAEISGDELLRSAWSEILESALATYEDFLPGASSTHQVMDRLHPFCYFLEGLIPELERPDVVSVYREGLDTVSQYLREIAPTFVRSDVYAQLLRARIYAASVVPVNEQAAAEAEALAEFEVASGDPRTEGGYLFGKRCGAIIPHVNPVSTAFAIQALEMWREHRGRAAQEIRPGEGLGATAGTVQPCLRFLI
jgi:hypothetical protein